MTAASYRLLQPHFVNNAYSDANTIVTEGVNIPVGWPPTLATDPLNSAALTNFAAQLPGLPQLIQSQFSNNVVQPPVTHWVINPTTGTTKWSLSGLGIGLTPVFY